MQVGTKHFGTKKPIIENTNLSIGKVYEVNIKAQSGILDPESVMNFVIGKWNEQFPEIRIVWMDVNPQKQTIDIQFRPVEAQALGLSPQPQRLFAISFTLLVTILSLVGIVIAGISIWEIVMAIPLWAWIGIGIGAVLILFGPQITGLAQKRYPTYIIKK